VTVNKKTIILSGSGSGIGREIAKKLDKEYNLILLSKSEKVFDLKKSLDSCIDAVECDFSDISETNLVIENILNKHNNIFGFINSAGVIGESGPLESTSYTSWEKVFNINVISPIIIANNLIKIFKNQRHGKIIFFGGGGSAYGYPVLPQYSSSKTALVRYIEIENVASFIESLLKTDIKLISGRLIHIRDDWLNIVNSKSPLNEELYKLRRVQK
jgi:short-subunit dehydrogenase